MHVNLPKTVPGASVVDAFVDGASVVVAFVDGASVVGDGAQFRCLFFSL